MDEIDRSPLLKRVDKKYGAGMWVKVSNCAFLQTMSHCSPSMEALNERKINQRCTVKGIGFINGERVRSASETGLHSVDDDSADVTAL
ncbi:uncharacterized protein V6R79_010143 [Siganus canaliculatus]